MGRDRRDVLIVEDDCPACRLFQPGDHPEKRGLAAAGRTEHADKGTVGHSELHVVDRSETAKLLRNVLKRQS